MYKVWVVSYHCNINNCHENAQCTNTERSFTCSCYLGYTGDGVNCASKILYSFYMTILHFSRGVTPGNTVCIHAYFVMHKLRKMNAETKTETNINSETKTERFVTCAPWCKIRKLWFIAWKTNLLAYIRFHPDVCACTCMLTVIQTIQTVSCDIW